ncbi:MAG TPA: hypothetical protein VNC61_00050 [Acidimicrobiales bacterium]|nr:hypothetical protein [Acidimicrobiales bacterium]
MPANRMGREEFFGKLATMDETGLKRALWNLYWRGSAALRERIDSELDPDGDGARKRPLKASVDPGAVLDEVSKFAALARSGAYLGGDRRVSPRERTRWRFTFRRLARDAQQAVSVEDDVGDGVAAMEQLIDLACETRGYDYFRSEEPLEAAQFVVSDAAALVWCTVKDHAAFARFAERATPQLIRWESSYGWTRTGFGPMREREISLARVLDGLLQVSDIWVVFADRYLEALDAVSGQGTARSERAGRFPDRSERARELAEWHLLLFDRLKDSEAEDRLDRLSRHRALDGPELSLLQGRLAHHRGDVSGARILVTAALEKLPGHEDLLTFAAQIGAPLPPQAQNVLMRLSPDRRPGARDHPPTVTDGARLPSEIPGRRR